MCQPERTRFQSTPIYRYRQARTSPTNRFHCGVILTQHSNFAHFHKKPTRRTYHKPQAPSADKVWLETNLKTHSVKLAYHPARLHRTQHQHGLAPVRNRRLENLHPRNRKPTTQTVKTLFKDMTTRRPNARTRSTPPKENFK